MQVLHEASGDLERAQGAAAEAAERAAGDSKAVKDLGVLPSTRQLAADCIEALSFLRTGLPPLRWSWPQGGEVRLLSPFRHRLGTPTHVRRLLLSLCLLGKPRGAGDQAGAWVCVLQQRETPSNSERASRSRSSPAAGAEHRA